MNDRSKNTQIRNSVRKQPQSLTKSKIIQNIKNIGQGIISANYSLDQQQVSRHSFS